jgi:[acyl-carrier-protein] S-malonyltransferase
MARDIVAGSKRAQAVFERADKVLGEPLSRLILEGPEDELTLTANAQPAIVTTSIAILEAVREAHPDLPAPAFAAGHSLGEYSALVAAGVLPFEDAIRIVRARGRSMQSAVPAGVGAMAAIMGLEPARVVELCAEARGQDVLSPANFNAPGQVVVAGHAAAVARVSDLVAAAKGRAIPLKVSAPFHCQLMEPAARVVADALASAPLSPFAFPIVSNVEALPNDDSRRAKDLLVRQVAGTVRWEESVRFMADSGVSVALELGPGTVLAGLVKRTAKTIKVLSVGNLEAVAAVPTFLANSP